MLGFVFQAEDGIRDLVRSRGLGDVYKRQVVDAASLAVGVPAVAQLAAMAGLGREETLAALERCLLYTSDAADERSSVDLGGRRIIKKKTRRDSVAPGDKVMTKRTEPSSYSKSQNNTKRAEELTRKK